MKQRISILLILVMIVTGMSSFFNQSYAITTYQKVTKYHLDMGAQHIWGTEDGNGTILWQERQ